ncbi:MAG: tetratricopeptide repeat protein [Tannerellaceae bacterium]|jgi:tetratricopeptide (TPR) repeat protein|nr:tetratricopeptide repeat protein [Tannerellaceae bacterium]
MKTKLVSAIGIVAIGVIGATAIWLSTDGYVRIASLAALILTVFIFLHQVVFKDKPVVLSKDYLHELAGEEIALRDKTIEDLNKQIAAMKNPKYKKAAKKYIKRGDYAKAIEIIGAYIKKYTSETAEVYIFQAQLYIANFQFKEAEEHYRKAVEIFPSLENTFAAAEFYCSLNRFNEAKDYYGRCLDMELSPSNRASVQNNLGNILEDSKDYPSAEKAYTEALEIKRTLADEYPQTYKPDLAGTLNNLGVLYQNKGEYDKAKEYYNEALEIYRERAYNAPDTYDPDLATTLNNLGVLHYARKDYEQAARHHNEALQLYRNLAAKDAKTYNPDLAMSLNNLGNVYYDMKRYDEAEDCFTEALSIYRELARNNPQAYNPYVATTFNNLGSLYATKAEPDYAKAEERYNECLKIRRALAAEHPQAWNPDLANTLSNMAAFYQDHVPNRAQSIQHAEEAIGILDQCSDTPYVNAARDLANAVLEDWESR